MYIGSSNGELMLLPQYYSDMDGGNDYNDSVDVIGDISDRFLNTSILPVPEPWDYGEELGPAEEHCPSEPPHYHLAVYPHEAYYPQHQNQQKLFFHELTVPAPAPQWTHKNIYDWTPQDSKDFIMDTAQAKNLKLSLIPIFKFNRISGIDLISINYTDFVETLNTEGNHSVSSYIGKEIYDELQKIKRECAVSDKSFNKLEDDHYGYCSDGEKKFTNLDIPNYETDCRRSSSSDSDSSCPGDYKPDGMGSYSLTIDPSAERPDSSNTVVKRAPGRPKGSGKKQNKKLKNVSVPEFLRDLLLNKDHCPSIIKWENYDSGTFRFVNATEVARLWGVLKRNKKMNFEKFSRAMRYHYKQKVLVSSVPRLVYQFGTAPNTPTYYTSNPNFDRPT